MREKIAQYLSYESRNKLIFAPRLDHHLQSVDVGFELSKAIDSDLTSKHLPMIAEDCLNTILRKAIREDNIIGEYIAIENWGILFEYDLTVAIRENLQRVALANTHCAAYLLRDNDPAQIVNTPYYPCCFHIYDPPYFCCAILILCNVAKNM